MNSLSMELGPIGIWTAQLDYQPAAKAQEAAAELEQLGFGAIWFPESVGRESLTQCCVTSRRNQPNRHCHRHRKYLRPRSGNDGRRSKYSG